MDRSIISDLLIEHEFPFQSLKKEQFDIIDALIKKQDVLAILPTGFGKSIVFALLPLIMNKLHPGRKHTAIVVSPLTALMADQVSYLRRHKIPAATLASTKDLDDLRDVSVLFTSPEAVAERRTVLKSFGHSACLLVFDEAHCISTWGNDFRPSYRKVPSIQSYFNVPNLVMTATITTRIQRDIVELLGLDAAKARVVATLPDRPNIFLHIQECTEKFEVELAWLLEGLQTGVKDKKYLIYVGSIAKCYELYLWLVTSLLDKCFLGEPSPVTRRVEMYHSNTDPDTKERIMEQFVTANGNIEVLISTVAFGMGVNVPNIDTIVHWGLPATSLRYWQEVGRCARDGRKGYAVCYAFKRSISKCEDDQLQKLAVDDRCIRHTVMQIFQLDGMDSFDLQKLSIRDVCDGTCETICICRRCQCCIQCQKLCLCEKRTVSPLSTFLKSH